MRTLNGVVAMIVCMFLFATSCDFKDKGVLEVAPVSDIVIDTTGIPLITYVPRGVEIDINPGASREGVNEGDLSYEWWITDKPGSAFTSKIVLSTEKHLKVNLDDLDPSQDYYSLWFRVTDKSTKLMNGVVLRVVIEPPLKQGLVVADSDNGISSDLSIIQDTIFTDGWINATTKAKLPTSILRNEFSRVHNKKFEGIIHSLFAQRAYQGGIYRNFLHGASKSNIFRINTIDYSIVGQGKSLFYDADKQLNIDSYMQNSSTVILVNNGKISTRLAESNTVVTYNKFGLEVPGNYKADAFIATHPTTSSNALFYDPIEQKFLRVGSSINVTVAPTVANATSTPFDAANMPGYTVLGAGLGNLSEARFIMNKDGKTEVYCINSSTGAAIRKIDISNAPDINNAVDFVVPVNQTVIYYATANKVYSIRIPVGNTPTYTELYTSPEPITHLKMMRRSGSKSLTYTEMVLLAVTFNGSEGKITTLPIPSTGLDLGLIDLNRSATFGGFKRISAVGIQE